MNKFKNLLTMLLLVTLSSCDVNINDSSLNSDISTPEDYSSSEFISSDIDNDSSSYNDISSETSSEESENSQSSEVSESQSEPEVPSEPSSEPETPSSSDSEPEQPSISEPSDSDPSSPSIEDPVEPDYDVKPTNFFTLETDGITQTYFQGDTFYINTWNNYLVLDNYGRIVYTVANAGCGYGMPIDEFYYSHPFYQDKIDSYVTDGYFEVPASCTGYAISYAAYGEFSNMVSDGIIPSKDFEDNGYGEHIKNWNSLENLYFDINSGIKVGSSTTESLVVKNSEPFRLSSIYDNTSTSGVATYLVYAPYADKYTLKCSAANEIEVFNSSKNSISKGSTSTSVNLSKDQQVYVKISASANTFFNLEVSLQDHNVELPYEINSSVDMSKLKTTSSSTSSPMKAAELKYTKRSDDRGLYVNSNNPENLTNYQNTYGSILNKVLMRQDVTEKDVFFTFEHNNLSANYYYGYRVTNTGSQDVYVTVKNLGYQIRGAGSWLGEDEWIKFYNTKFYTDTSNYTSSQKSNYDAYVGFSNAYESENRKPITYRLPAGKYFYVLGGTTADAYQNINVFNSANKVVNGGCSNAAVLFSVTGGSAEASFMLYTDRNAAKINATDYVTGNNQIGYVSDDHFGVQYGGYDDCHGVVDADILYTFNDATASDYLPVSYTNPYYSTTYTGTPYGKLTNMKAKEHYSWSWTTHISAFDNASAVGTDMTDYINVDYKTKKKIEIDSAHYDGRGKAPNIGNWMVDYIDTFTLVNQGNKAREFTYTLKHTGVILAFVRDENGFIKQDIQPKYYIKVNASSYGDTIEDLFEYTVKVPAHSIVRFSVDYNLLANSYGTISHRAYLK